MTEPKFVYTTVEGRGITETIEVLNRIALALLFAAFDMVQTSAACDLLEEETSDAARARALETAIAVCYARGFTESTLRRLSERSFAPKKGTPDRKLHDMLMRLRKKVYAHTDEDSGRVIERLTRAEDGEVATLAYQESWHPLDRDLLDPIRELCAKQRERVQLEATRILTAIETARGGGSTA